jgi:hypothetical protein
LWISRIEVVSKEKEAYEILYSIDDKRDGIIATDLPPLSSPLLLIR